MSFVGRVATPMFLTFLFCSKVLLLSLEGSASEVMSLPMRFVSRVPWSTKRWKLLFCVLVKNLGKNSLR